MKSLPELPRPPMSLDPGGFWIPPGMEPAGPRFDTNFGEENSPWLKVHPSAPLSSLPKPRIPCIFLSWLKSENHKNTNGQIKFFLKRKPEPPPREFVIFVIFEISVWIVRRRNPQHFFRAVPPNPNIDSLDSLFNLNILPIFCTSPRPWGLFKNNSRPIHGKTPQINPGQQEITTGSSPQRLQLHLSHPHKPNSSIFHPSVPVPSFPSNGLYYFCTIFAIKWLNLKAG